MTKLKYVLITLNILPFCIIFISCKDSYKVQTPCTKTITSFYNRDRKELLYKRQVLCEDTTVRYGSDIFYNQNGKIGDVNFYINNVREGIQTSYDTSGNLTSIELRKHGILDGVTTFYWPNGKVYQERTYNNGKLVHVSYQDTLGNQLYAGSLHNGNGEVYFHNSKQQLVIITPYKDGLENGLLTFVDSLGNREADSSSRYVNGKKVFE